jgi:hypothetical protein
VETPLTLTPCDREHLSCDIPERWPTSAAGHPTGGARRLGSVVSGDAHVCACVLRREARDHVQCDAPRFCGIPSKWNIERQLIVSEEDAALASIGSRECDESLHFARWPNFEFHARSIGPYLRDERSRSGDIREHSPSGPSCSPAAVVEHRASDAVALRCHALSSRRALHDLSRRCGRGMGGTRSVG